MQQNQYDKEPLTAVEAQRLAQEIAFGPIVFQVSRLMLKFGIFQLLADERAGMTQEEISKACGLSSYATQVLLEASLTIGTVLQHENRYRLAKAGWFLLNDKMVRVNMDFNHDVNYLGMFHLEEALTNGRPEGLKVFGEWSTIYEGLSSLPSQVQKSWFGFDHYYSDCSFDEALAIVFARHPKTLLDVGGNTGRWATKCVSYDDAVEVTIMDLPQQLEMMPESSAHPNWPTANAHTLAMGRSLMADFAGATCTPVTLAVVALPILTTSESTLTQCQNPVYTGTPCVLR